MNGPYCDHLSLYLEHYGKNKQTNKKLFKLTDDGQTNGLSNASSVLLDLCLLNYHEFHISSPHFQWTEICGNSNGNTTSWQTSRVGSDVMTYCFPFWCGQKERTGFPMSALENLQQGHAWRHLTGGWYGEEGGSCSAVGRPRLQLTCWWMNCRWMKLICWAEEKEGSLSYIISWK